MQNIIWYRASTAALVVGVLGTPACKPRSPGTATHEQSTLQDDGDATDASPFQFFQSPRDLIRYAADTLKDQKIKTKFDIFSLSALTFAEFGGNFQASIDQLDDQTVMREERWRLRSDIGPGALVMGLSPAQSLPVNINIMGGREVIFTRKFADYNDAARAPIVTFADLPLTAEKALELTPDDFVSIPSSTGIALGLGFQNYGFHSAVSAGTSVFWTGEYRLNIYRMAGSYIRIKVAPLSQKGLELHASAAASLDYFGSYFDGLLNLDRQIERNLGLDFMRYTRSRIFEGDRFAIDYIFNLDSSDARKAYDLFFKRTLTLKRGIRNFHVLPNGINNNSIFADLTPVESLAAYSETINDVQRRPITRSFMGKDQFASDALNVRLGTKALRLSKQRNLSFHKLVFTDADSEFKHQAVQLYTSLNATKSWVKFYRESFSTSLLALFNSARGFRSHQFDQLHFKWSINQADLSSGEIRDLREMQKVIIGPDYYAKLMHTEGLNLGSNPKGFKSQLTAYIPSAFMTMFHQRIKQNPEDTLNQVIAAIDASIARYRATRSRFQQFNENLTLAFRGDWRGIEGSIKDPIIAHTRNILRTGDANYIGELFKIANAPHPAGEIIVPAFLFELAQRIGVEPHASLEESLRDGTKFYEAYGRDAGESMRAGTNAALYGITNLGL